MPDFKSGDSAWMVQSRNKEIPCPFCGGLGYVGTTGVNGESDNARCPHCTGDRHITVYTYKPIKCTIKSVSILYRTTNGNLFGDGTATRIPYATEQEARSVADELNREVV